MKKWLFIGGSIIVIVIVMLQFYPSLIEKQKADLDKANEKTILPIKIAEVTETEFADFVEAVGSTFAYESAEITSNVTEVVEKINFRDGQHVKKGDVIVVLRYAEENAQLSGARANLKEQEREIERLTGLVKNGAAAVSALDARNTQKQVAEQQILQFQAQVSDRIIRAPFDGILGLRNISVGSLVSPQNVITTIDDLSTMRVDFTVPEIYLGQVSSNLPIHAVSQAYPDQIFEGKVTEIDTRVDPSSRAIRVRAEIPNERQLLKPGMLLYVELALEKGTSPSIPERSVLQTGEKKFAFKVSKDFVQRTEITLGRRKPGYVEVVSGLALGDSVATSGLQDLDDGTSVEINGVYEPSTQSIENIELSE
ncbi:efflux RND transporter periplasmic adaptor subunit [Catalinimonas niigatensis]|uniref:efflux RND transporter periplasmic adaptor subunit n=1 Tax=Catalinimonas niigatensis TaxID=1397264 RepID=UPI002666D29C|nr:efflux RND transporter periplasmic adaptor subunit [Catalinimonas niigatensis]WPP52010.1 efflux RND transporter periplasmic adaptor subunit [Catalinimonas niigatensis]